MAGTGTAAAVYLLDPRQGKARRARILATIHPERGRAVQGDPPSALPENLAPGRATPPSPPRGDEPIPYTPPELFDHEPVPVATPDAADGDGQIVRTVRTSLEQRRDLRTDDLVVDVVNGVAYLTGSLHDPHTFGEVVDLTGEVPGVRRVQSLLHLPHSETIARTNEGRSPAAG